MVTSKELPTELIFEWIFECSDGVLEVSQPGGKGLPKFKMYPIFPRSALGAAARIAYAPANAVICAIAMVRCADLHRALISMASVGCNSREAGSSLATAVALAMYIYRRGTPDLTTESGVKDFKRHLDSSITIARHMREY